MVSGGGEEEVLAAAAEVSAGLAEGEAEVEEQVAVSEDRRRQYHGKVE